MTSGDVCDARIPVVGASSGIGREFAARIGDASHAVSQQLYAPTCAY